MGNRNRDILKRMKIVYMSSGLNTIHDLPPKLKRRKLMSESSCSITSMPSRSSKSSKTPEPKTNAALKGASPKSSSPPTVKPIKKGKSGKAEAKPKFETLLKNLPLTERRLLQARNGIPLKLTEDCPELPVDYSSVTGYCAKQLSDFTDVNEGEKKIMKMWNQYIIGHMGRSFSHLARLLEGFIKDKGREIVTEGLYRNALLMISSFQHNGVLDAIDCLTSKSQLQIHVAEHMEKQDHISLTSSTPNLPEISNGVGTSKFYGAAIQQTPPNFRRSVDDHLPCRRKLSPVMASRTLSVDEDVGPRLSRKGRPRINSKGGGSSPGRGSPVRGSGGPGNIQSSQNQTESRTGVTETAPNSPGLLGAYRRTVIVSKRGSVIRKNLWQGDSDRLNVSAPAVPDSVNRSVEARNNRSYARRKSSQNSMEMQTNNMSSIQPLITNPGKAYCSHIQQSREQESQSYNCCLKRKKDSPSDIQNFLEAFDQKNVVDIEDPEAELPVFVVIPKSKRLAHSEQNLETRVIKSTNYRENLSLSTQQDDDTDSDDCQIIKQVYSPHRRASRSKQS